MQPDTSAMSRRWGATAQLPDPETARILCDLSRRLMAMRDGRGSAGAIRQAREALVAAGTDPALAERSVRAMADTVSVVRKRASSWVAAMHTEADE